MTSSRDLIDRIERHFADPETGLLFSYLDRETLLPPDDAFFRDAQALDEHRLPGLTPAALYRHENFGMVTGSYMQSEILRYRLEGDPAALAHARRGLAGFRRVYEMGKRLDRGFFPKIYGGRFSEETSTDQVLYACTALEALHPYADAAERAVIEELVGELVDFWVRRDYRYHYFKFHGDDWQWPLLRFPPLLILAYHFTGREHFRREYLRLVDRTAKPEHCQLHNKRLGIDEPIEYERANRAWLTFHGADRATMDIMHFDLLLRHDPGHPLAPAWRDGIRIMWDEVKDSLAQDGRYYTMQLWDFGTFRPRRTPGGDPYPGAKSAWSAMVGRAGLQGLAHCPDLPGATQYADRVLAELDFSSCAYYDEPERFAPHERYKTRLLSGDAAANLAWCARLRSKIFADQPRGVAVEDRLTVNL